MYNCTEQRWLEGNYSAVGEGKVFFRRNVKPWTFGLGVAPKENFLTYSTQFAYLTTRIIPGNEVMAIIKMCGNGRVLSRGVGM